MVKIMCDAEGVEIAVKIGGVAGDDEARCEGGAMEDV